MTETQGHAALPGILERIVRTKREELDALRPRARELEAALDGARPPRGMAAALSVPGTVSLIAECKRRSPGAGDIRPDLDPVDLVRGYEAAGASALSVLTDTAYFGGTLADLRAAGSATTIPVLRKDFTLDPLHVVEARAAGADAILLIVRILGDDALRALHDEATGLGMDVLVEVHDRSELERALELDLRILGINNRDLATFTTDLATTERLLMDVPGDVVVVSESGIRTRDDVRRLGSWGVDAILVGESLLKADDPAKAAEGLSGVANRPRGPRVKICGLRRSEDARRAEASGADYLGLVLTPGFERSVPLDVAPSVVAGTTVPKVAVLVDPSPGEVGAAADAIGASVVQLHGSEGPDVVREVRLRGDWTLWKAVRARGVEELARAARDLGGLVDGILVEGWREGVVGGAGVRVTLDPEAVRAAIPDGVELILAGGLEPANVADAVARFRPAVVDVSSGVEEEVGRKDAALMDAFVLAARRP